MRGTLLPDRMSDFGPVAPVFSAVTGGFYQEEIDCLRVADGGTSALESFDTADLATGAKIEIIFGDPPSEQDFKLLAGAADGTIPYDEVNAFNSAAGAGARHWKKVGGY